MLQTQLLTGQLAEDPPVENMFQMPFSRYWALGPHSYLTASVYQVYMQTSGITSAAGSQGPCFTLSAQNYLRSCWNFRSPCKPVSQEGSRREANAISRKQVHQQFSDQTRSSHRFAQCQEAGLQQVTAWGRDLQGDTGRMVSALHYGPLQRNFLVLPQSFIVSKKRKPQEKKKKHNTLCSVSDRTHPKYLFQSASGSIL